jgi:hypothetical protein
MPFWRARISSSVDYLLRQCAPVRFPVDLMRLASTQGIARIHFRPMPCDGAIEVVADGFVVHMRAAKDQLVPTLSVNSNALSARQRFTLAHEISHSFFYDAVRKPCKPHPSQPLLEAVCNYGAQRLLLPDGLVEREIGAGRRFDSIEMAHDIASAAKVSVEVVLRRLDELERLKEADYALLTFEKQDDGSIVTTGVCLNGVFKKFPRPTLYVAPPKWVAKIALDLSAPTGTVRRSAYRDGWEFISRSVASKQSPNQLLLECRLEMTLHEQSA